MIGLWESMSDVMQVVVKFFFLYCSHRECGVFCDGPFHVNSCNGVVVPGVGCFLCAQYSFR